MRDLFLLLSVCLAALSSQGQSNLSSVSRIAGTNLIDTLANTDSQIMGNQMQMLKDYSGKVTFDEVSQKPLDSAFHKNEGKIFDLSVYLYWFRFRLKNMMPHDAAISFQSSAEYCDYYIKHSGNTVEHLRTGWGVPWSKKDGFKLNNLVSLIIKPSEEVLVYYRERNNAAYLFPKNNVINYYYTKDVIQRFNRDYSYYVIIGVQMLLAGILILSAVFNFFFFKTTKDKAYLYFALFAVCYALSPYSSDLLLYFLRERPGLGHDIVSFIWVPSTIFLANFILYYFEAKRYLRKWSMALTVLLYVYAVQGVTFLFVENSVSDLWRKIVPDSQDFTLNTISLLLFVICVLYLKQKGAVKGKIVPALPMLFFWGVVWPCTFYSKVLAAYFDRPQPRLYKWLGRWNFLFELIFLTWLVLFFSWNLFRRYQQLQKQIAADALHKEKERNQLIAQQKVELEKQVAVRTADLKQSLEELKAMQHQLIQTEKMASLGELTAGIAHEIQNPLNFVKNFSEVNGELLAELEDQAENGNIGEIKLIARAINENEQKIIHHGKRADAIVKGMLQHSRERSGRKELTDINAMCDEYLRLAYHGLRAKDKTFSAKFETSFDDTIGRVSVVPQDIGRVLLNLINNAFYAVTEKNRQVNGSYGPCVSIRTTKLPSKIEITVEDNGNGIPEKLKDKIFQPFFTTKPPGQGTGLGLSLAYDIVKAHGGEIRVETKEGEGAAFTIALPILKN